MDRHLAEKIAASSRYRELVRRRSRFGWALSATVFAMFTGYTLLIAFDKQLLARPIGEGVTSWGIPLGMGVIVISVVLTAIYVSFANRVIDPEMARLLEEVGQ